MPSNLRVAVLVAVTLGLVSLPLSHGDGLEAKPSGEVHSNLSKNKGAWQHSGEFSLNNPCHKWEFSFDDVDEKVEKSYANSRTLAIDLNVVQRENYRASLPMIDYAVMLMPGEKIPDCSDKKLEKYFPQKNIKRDLPNNVDAETKERMENLATGFRAATASFPPGVVFSTLDLGGNQQGPGRMLNHHFTTDGCGIHKQGPFTLIIRANLASLENSTMPYALLFSAGPVPEALVTACESRDRVKEVLGDNVASVLFFVLMCPLVVAGGICCLMCCVVWSRYYLKTNARNSAGKEKEMTSFANRARQAAADMGSKTKSRKNYDKVPGEDTGNDSDP